MRLTLRSVGSGIPGSIREARADGGRLSCARIAAAAIAASANDGREWSTADAAAIMIAERGDCSDSGALGAPPLAGATAAAALGHDGRGHS
jgi:hypothetical protein